MTPEGIDAAAHRRLIGALWKQGCRFFCLAYHSPSLVPGRTPYVRDQAQLRLFLDTLRATCGYVIEELGAVPATPSDLYRLWSEEDAQAA